MSWDGCQYSVVSISAHYSVSISVSGVLGLVSQYRPGQAAHPLRHFVPRPGEKEVSSVIGKQRGKSDEV